MGIDEVINRKGFLEDLHESVTAVLSGALIKIDDGIRCGREDSERKIPTSGKEEGHYTSILDRRIEEDSAGDLRVLFNRKCDVPATLIDIHGEESLGQSVQEKDLSRSRNLTVLADMIDGTDLLFRELGNWCSALVVFIPQEKKILSSYVGMIFGDFLSIYYSRMMPGGSYKTGLQRVPVILRKDGRRVVMSKKLKRLELAPQNYEVSDIPLDGASISYYGQKVERHMKVAEGTRFFSSPELWDAKHTRIYNLGGNPMMARVAEGRMSAVFETKGQFPHDVVPGAFICRNAGCVVTDLEGKELDLAQSLLVPNTKDKNKKLKYLISCNSTLHNQLLPYLQPKSNS